MTVGKQNIEMDAVPKHGGDQRPATESTALQHFSQAYLAEQQLSAGETKKADKTAPEKLFLDRLSKISMNADSGTDKVASQAHVAWNKLFNPSGFAPGESKTHGESESVDLDLDGVYERKNERV